MAHMVEDMGYLKKIYIAGLIVVGQLAAMPAMAQVGPACNGPFKPLPWMGQAFFSAFCNLCSQGFFNNFFNASFW